MSAVSVHYCTCNRDPQHAVNLDEDDGLYDSMVYQQRKKLKSKDTTQIIKSIRVFLGGGVGLHYEAFSKACINMSIQKYVEYLTNLDIKRSRPTWTHPHFLVSWLLDCNIHFILCQNLYLGFEGLWGIEATIAELRRLESHDGYPNGIKLRCPVTNGGKYTYLSSIKSYCNPTLKLPLKFFKDVLYDDFSESKECRGYDKHILKVHCDLHVYCDPFFFLSSNVFRYY